MTDVQSPQPEVWPKPPASTRRNYPRILTLAIIAVLWIVIGAQKVVEWASTSEPRAAYSYGTNIGYTDGQERVAERYFDELALQLAEPGLWVDPKSRSMLPDGAIADLDRAAKSAPVPVRLAVIPAEVLIDPAQSTDYRTVLLWESPEMATKLYERVGVDGVYAILVDASSSSSGRGIWAVQHAADGPTYHVESAVDQAIECCAPRYAPMLDRFIKRSSQIDHPWYVYAAPVAGGIVGLFGVWWGAAARHSRRQQRREEQQHVQAVLPLLHEEVIELSEKVSALPTTADIEQAQLTRQVLDTVEKARHRLDALTKDDDTQAVTTLLGDTRYMLHCLTALHRGEPRPERTPPCFFDPRHGPSTTQRQWAPDTAGTEREIPTCAECADRLDSKQAPEIRFVGTSRYWETGENLVAYIDGYWRTDGYAWRFPDQRHHRAREAIRRRRHDRRPSQRLNRGAQRTGRFIHSAAKHAAKSSSSGGGRGGGRGSFGGGSSRSSSVRSSGGRRF
jgi:uncharacterized membrane protein YgcG